MRQQLAQHGARAGIERHPESHTEAILRPVWPLTRERKPLALGPYLVQAARHGWFADPQLAMAIGCAIFLVATLPNLLFGPIAGTLVDRWDHREVMIVSDLLRAGLVLLIPIAAVTNLALAYPLVFLLTTVSIFFRPA